MTRKIGFGGGCHWCTEAVFKSLRGVQSVEQGWIASFPPNGSFSEAVIVLFDPQEIRLHDLIDIHLHTHSSTSNHSMRGKYRSAIYYFDTGDAAEATNSIAALQSNFQDAIITTVLPYVDFKPSLPEHLNYYHSDPAKPFCKLYIDPKLAMLQQKYSYHVERM